MTNLLNRLLNAKMDFRNLLIITGALLFIFAVSLLVLCALMPAGH